MHTYMHAITVKKLGHVFEENQGRVCGRVLREEWGREKCHYILISKTLKKISVATWLWMWTAGGSSQVAYVPGPECLKDASTKTKRDLISVTWVNLHPGRGALTCSVCAYSSCMKWMFSRKNTILSWLVNQFNQGGFSTYNIHWSPISAPSLPQKGW